MCTFSITSFHSLYTDDFLNPLCTINDPVSALSIYCPNPYRQASILMERFLPRPPMASGTKPQGPLHILWHCQYHLCFSELFFSSADLRKSILVLLHTLWPMLLLLLLTPNCGTFSRFRSQYSALPSLSAFSSSQISSTFTVSIISPAGHVVN